MFRRSCRLCALTLVCIPAFPVLSQIPKTSQPLNSAKPIPAYTAEIKIVNVQTLADGTTITRERTELRAQDSQGRTLSIDTQPQFTSGIIKNPVNNTEILWNSAMKADVIQLPPQDQRQGCWATDSHRMSIGYAAVPGAPVKPRGGVGGGGSTAEISQPGQVLKNQVTREDLGMSTIQGLQAKGERVTIVIPAGNAGNDKAITTTREFWRVPEFPFVMREIYEDPRTGKRTTEVESLTIAEPDLNLFQPPEGYEVVNEEMHPVACQQ